MNTFSFALGLLWHRRLDILLKVQELSIKKKIDKRLCSKKTHESEQVLWSLDSLSAWIHFLYFGFHVGSCLLI